MDQVPGSPEIISQKESKDSSSLDIELNESKESASSDVIVLDESDGVKDDVPMIAQKEADDVANIEIAAATQTVEELVTAEENQEKCTTTSQTDSTIDKTDQSTTTDIATEKTDASTATSTESNESSAPKNTSNEPLLSDDVQSDEPNVELNLEEVHTEDKEGECEELCIIPDTDRVITQEEKDAAALVESVRDAIENIEPLDAEVLQTQVETVIENYVLSNCTEETINACEQCCLPRKSKFKVEFESKTHYICDDNCLKTYKANLGDKLIDNTQNIASQGDGAAVVPFSRKCIDCKKQISNSDKSVLMWETLEFCNDVCLSRYQKMIGSSCSKCQAPVQDICMGKYCVRFGFNIRQFCRGLCLEQYKQGLKVCSYCQKEMSNEGFLAPVMDKSMFKDFCTTECLVKYKSLSKISGSTLSGKCSVCSNDKPKFNFKRGTKTDLFCGDPCFVAFKFVNNISAGKCEMCHNYFDNVVITEFAMYYDDALRIFCSKGCQNVYILANRKITPCSWCKVKKYNFDMIKRQNESGTPFLTCSLNCLNVQLASWNKDDFTNWTTCDQCNIVKHPLYYLSMSDDSVKSFCSYSCVVGFQSKFSKGPSKLIQPTPVSGPKRFIAKGGAKKSKASKVESPTIPIITSVQSLANVNGAQSYNRNLVKQNGVVAHHASSPSKTIIKTQIKQQVIVKPPLPVLQRNVSTMCKVTMYDKGTNCKLYVTSNKAMQTDEVKPKLIVIPVPVPIYVPLPMHMYCQPYPLPFPFPLPIPTPVFIPTTRNSAKGIMKEIKKIQAKMPSNPLEAELLMMADMVAGDTKDDATDSETEGEEATELVDDRPVTPEPNEANNSFNEDVMQMAIKIASELEEPPQDLERSLAVSTVTAPIKIESSPTHAPVTPEPTHLERRSTRGRGRGSRGRRQSRRSNSHSDTPVVEPVESTPPEPLEKPDANMCLKYTFGVNAWKQWVATKNAELELSSSKAKLFKSEILQLTADELNYSLCLFVKEVRKPNGQEYAPDTIYYLCLGIQQYLYESNRIDNIFCDTYYEKFTDCLDEIAKKFSVLYNDSHYIITRVEEEHLWESKQLGAHSPHVLLSTLMFFNTKHFNLTSVEDHNQLSFSHIMKHWKRSSGGHKTPGSRNVLLRFYPPQTSTPGSRRKKVYEQLENEDNPLRCPVKLYEFYLSKCPESVKTRNDVFYLLPERSCVPDSPVWYSTSALPLDALEKMLHRVKMVKEINVSLLTS